MRCVPRSWPGPTSSSDPAPSRWTASGSGFASSRAAFRWATSRRRSVACAKRFPNRAEGLIRVKETLDRAALRKLPAAELAQIGVTMEKATDEVTIAAASGDLDRVVAALLDDAAHAEAA